MKNDRVFAEIFQSHDLVPGNDDVMVIFDMISSSCVNYHSKSQIVAATVFLKQNKNSFEIRWKTLVRNESQNGPKAKKAIIREKNVTHGYTFSSFISIVRCSCRREIRRRYENGGIERDGLAV